jgi:photosystem II stability/assembly factor-like uncharacterized protein
MSNTSSELAIVYGIAVATGDGDAPVLFAAATAGLRRSEDGGATWRDAWSTLTLTEPLAATSVAVSPGWVHDRTVFCAAPGGVFRSTDGGHEWELAHLPRPTPFVSQLLLSPDYVNDGIVWAGTVEDGVYRSGDRGVTWQAWNIGLLDPNILCMAASPAFPADRTLFVGTDSGIFRSTNTGRFWHETPFDMDDAPVLCLGVSPRFADDCTLLAGTETRGLWRSEDGGDQWQRVKGLDTADPINAVVFDGAHMLVMLDERLMQSEDGGQTWRVRADAPGDTSFTALAAPRGLGGSLVAGLSDGRVIYMP